MARLPTPDGDASSVPDAEITVIKDQEYACPDGNSLKADIYVPGSVDPIPVVVFLHGGGFRIGDRHLAPDFKRFFARCGFAMVSIDYRLSGQAIFPAAVEDVKTAIRWVRSCSRKFGLDPDRIGLWGSSAGGNLASLCAVTGPDFHAGSAYVDHSSAVQAVVDGYGPTDFLREDAYRDAAAKPSDDPESLQLPQGKRSDDPDSLESQYLGTPITLVSNLVEQTNPVTFVRAGAPPFLIMHGLSDTMVPHDQSQILFEALSHSGNSATLALIEGLGHGFFDRNDLDDAGPRTMNIWRCGAGGLEGPTQEQHSVFNFVHQFLQRHLSGAQQRAPD